MRVVLYFTEGKYAGIPVILGTTDFMLQQLEVDTFPSHFPEVPDPEGRITSLALIKVTKHLVAYREMPPTPVNNAEPKDTP